MVTDEDYAKATGKDVIESDETDLGQPPKGKQKPS